MIKARILIVEDESIIASVIAGALHKFAFEVADIVNTGESAITAALQKKPDLILMDIRLQGPMDGISAAERILEQIDIPVIYLTAYADELTLERAKKTKPYGYIPKPFQEIELKTTIEMSLYKHGFERQLKESEAKFRSLFENSIDVIYIVDRSGFLREMNPAGLSLFGYSPEEILNRQPTFLYTAPQERESLLQEIWARGHVRNFEVHLRKKNGEGLVGRITANTFSDSKGRVLGFEAILRDVTLEKKLEEQILQTAKIDSLGRLASGMAHDFNNYLTIINGYAEMLLDENKDGTNGENLKIILQAGKSASKLVAKILGFSRRKNSTAAIIDINTTLSDLERMVRRLVGKQIELYLELDPEAGCVYIDPVQFEQMLINLVINARDAMANGGKLSLKSNPITLDDIQAAEHPELHAGKYVAIDVQDSGSGMEPEVLARIFEPFFTTKPAGEGTGLGLALTFSLVTQNQGAVWAESKPGQGSTFHILLPQATVAPGVEPERRSERHFQGKTVLLIEDEQNIRQLLHAILESLGLEVHEAVDGVQGIKVAEKLPRLDLLFTDVVLPGLSGVKVAERVRELHPEAAVIFNSGQGESCLKRAGLNTKTMNFIPKPSSRKIIGEKIAEVLG